MSGFEMWAASIQGTAAIAGCTLVLGVLLGWLATTAPRHVSRRERRELAGRAEARALRAHARWISAARGTRGGTVMPHRPTDLPCGCPRGMRYHAINCPDFPSQLQAPEVAHEWEPAHVASALALTTDPSGDPSVTAWTQAMAAGMDAWLAEHVYGVPYSADELWSGQ